MALWVVLFNIEIDGLRSEVGQFFEFLQQAVLEEKLELPEPIKVFLFLKTLWLNFASKSSNKVDQISHPFNKRIKDLMRAEFATFNCGENEAISRNTHDLVSYIINEPQSLFVTFQVASSYYNHF